MSTKLWISISLLVLVYSPLIVTGQSSCPLPTVADIERELIDLVTVADGGGPYAPNVSSYQYTCLAQGSARDTYRRVSIIATFTPNSGVAERREHFQLECSSGTWRARTNDGIETPPSNPMLRRDCFTCVLENLGADSNHCLECSATCRNMGQGSCVSNINDCCPFFGLDNMCTTSCPTNYAASANTDFVCVCNYTCGPGEVPNATCNGCDLTDICLRDMPCQNGGSCTLLSAPDNYTCDCIGTGYIGTNCTVVCNYTCGPGEVANATCNGCDLTDICLRDMPCQNGGSCILLSASDNYTCDCSSIPYSGEHCDVCPLSCTAGYNVTNGCTGCKLSDICVANNPCQNGGTCILENSPDQYNCTCLTDYSGENCTECVKECQNGGSPSPNCTTCHCAVGYTGPNCEDDIDYCHSRPCGNYGSCTDNVDGYTCDCRDGWSGDRCDVCNIVNCMTCSATPPICTDCIKGYVVSGSGKECQLEDVCPSLPCRNNGTCLGRPGSYVCECVKPWTGTNCTLCEDRYGLREGQCVPCRDNCLLCALNAGECTQCDNGYSIGDDAQCISNNLPTSTLIWIIIGCVLGVLIVLAIVFGIVMTFVRCAGKMKEDSAHKQANRDAFKAGKGNVSNKNPLYISSDDLDKALST